MKFGASSLVLGNPICSYATPAIVKTACHILPVHSPHVLNNLKVLINFTCERVMHAKKITA